MSARGRIACTVLLTFGAAAFVLEPRGMARSWLFAWLFAMGISLGAMANLMVHTLTHGRWGEPLRPPLIAATRMLPWISLLGLPVLIGVRSIFPWAAGVPDPRPASWLNVPFFELRAAVILVAWNSLAAWWLRSDARTADPATGASGGASRASIVGLGLYTLTITVAAFDWVAALEPAWYSSALGLVLAVGQMLAGAAFGIALAAFGAGRRPSSEAAQRFNDLGNLLLMYVLTWAYLAFAEFLIIWSGNLPHEIAWYRARLATSWWPLGAFLVAFHFFVPLVLLLVRANKRTPRRLAAIAVALLVAHVADDFWLVAPSLRPQGFSIAWTDAVALLGVASAWCLAWPWAGRGRNRRAEGNPRELARG